MSYLPFYKRIMIETNKEESAGKKFLHNLLKIIFRIFDKFYFDNCMIKASGLAFNSLLALVPLSAILFAFGGLNNVGSSLENVLMEVLLPSSLNQIVDALNTFTENSTKLGTYGIILFLITIVLLMNNIENNLNSIWNCKKKRRFFQRVTTYTTVLVFGSLLIGGNFSISGSILAIIPNYAQALELPFLIQIGYRASSIFFITLTLLLLIIMIPTVKVSFKSALTGALTGAVLWELAKWGFKTWASYSVRNSVIYGSLFLIPLLLIWLYVVWLIIMITMETAYVHNHRREQHIRYSANVSLADSFSMMTSLYINIASAYSNGNIRADSSYLAEMTGISDRKVSTFTARLLSEGLIIKSDTGFFLPASSPERMELSKLYSIISGMNENQRTSVSDFCRGGSTVLNNKTVSDLINHNEKIEK